MILCNHSYKMNFFFIHIFLLHASWFQHISESKDISTFGQVGGFSVWTSPTVKSSMGMVVWVCVWAVGWCLGARLSCGMTYRTQTEDPQPLNCARRDYRKLGPRQNSSRNDGALFSFLLLGLEGNPTPSPSPPSMTPSMIRVQITQGLSVID